jgi:putative phage-type endonuclease
MKIVNLEQGSSEWLIWRQGGLGASEISVLMGTNPYKTPLKLWEVKCGFSQEDPINRAMQHGIDNEDIARQWVNTKFHLDLKPLCIEDENHSHYKASLDGYDEANGVVYEIKCPSSQKTLDAAINDGVIHDYWKDQVIWQSGLANVKKSFITLWDYRTLEGITLPVEFNELRFNQMKVAADKFWQSVKMGAPPSPQKGDFLEVEDEKLFSVLAKYSEAIADKKKVETLVKDLKAQIETFGDDGNFTAYGYKIVRMMPPSSYDISKMREDGIDVDKYLKKSKSIGYYRIFPPKN